MLMLKQVIEKASFEELRHWSNIEDRILPQKSRINWVKLGDANTKFVFAATKARLAHDRINMLSDDAGRQVG